jgi:hypothetical protein
MRGIEIEGFVPFVFDLPCQTHYMRGLTYRTERKNCSFLKLVSKVVLVFFIKITNNIFVGF